MFEHETFVRAMQWYILLLAICTFIYALFVGPRINKLRFSGAHIYYSFIFIFVLSLVQIKQCLGLLSSPVTKVWWYPFFCKHISLLVYIAILTCVRACMQRKGDEK